ncbi:MAG: U32 family peptidase [Thermodesulfobacteriota bacterium]
MIKIPELLAPAGNFEKLKAAIHYGADAVYLGGQQFSLRAHAANFSEIEIGRAVAYAHDRGVKVYVTVNILAHNRDFKDLPSYLADLGKAGVDGLIISDPGIMKLAREIVPNLAVHLSTQANVTNLESARFWQEQGVKRINAARELSLAEITEIKAGTELEIEIRNKRFPSVIVKPPFYKKASHK